MTMTFSQAMSGKAPHVMAANPLLRGQPQNLHQPAGSVLGNPFEVDMRGAVGRFGFPSLDRLASFVDGCTEIGPWRARTLQFLN
jgi:hypothetical protein